MFCVSRAPTEIAEGALPGLLMPAYPTWPVTRFTPLLPADATTTMPLATARSTACTRGSVAAGSKIGWPRDRLITSMPYVARLSIANCTARTTSLVRPDPCASSTLSEINRTFGARPP